MSTTQQAPTSRVINLSELDWEEAGPGRWSKQIWADPETKRRAVMTRFGPNIKLPLHRHDGDELVYVLEGAIADEHGVLASGHVGYRPNGCVHSISCPKGATVIAIITGGVEPAESMDGAPASQIIALHDIPWEDARPGVRRKSIWEDKAGSRRLGMSRFEPGATLPHHRHVGDELIFVIEGAVEDAAGIVTAGNMNNRPFGCEHTVTTKNGATVLAMVWGSTEPL